MNSLKPEMLFAWATSVAAKTSEATVMSDPYYGDEKNFEHVLDLVE